MVVPLLLVDFIVIKSRLISGSIVERNDIIVIFCLLHRYRIFQVVPGFLTDDIFRLLRFAFPLLYEVYSSTASTKLQYFANASEILHRNLPLLSLLRLDVAARSDNRLEVGNMRSWRDVILLGLLVLKL